MFANVSQMQYSFSNSSVHSVSHATLLIHIILLSRHSFGEEVKCRGKEKKGQDEYRISVMFKTLSTVATAVRP